MQIGIDARFVQDQYHGIGRYTFNLIEELLRLPETGSQDTYHIFYNPAYQNSRFGLEKLLSQPGAIGHPIKLKLYLPPEQLELPRLAARLKLDLFHSPYFIAPLAIPCRLVLTIHDLIFDRYPQYMPQRGFLVYYKLMSWLATRRAAAIVVPSAATAAELNHFYPATKNKTHFVPEATDSYFQPVTSSDKLAEVRERYQLPEKFILTLGTRRPHKNVPLLLTAFAQLTGRLPHHLVIAGQPDKRWPDDTRELTSRWHLDQQVHYPGHIAEEDLASLYSLADLVVFPSRVEGFGLPPLEAMACGTPAIVSNTSSLVEVALDPTMMVDPDNVQGLAELIWKILDPAQSQYRAELGQRSLGRAAEFSWARIAWQTRQIYAQACKEKPLAPFATPEKILK